MALSQYGTQLFMWLISYNIEIASIITYFIEVACQICSKELVILLLFSRFSYKDLYCDLLDLYTKISLVFSCY